MTVDVIVLPGIVVVITIIGDCCWCDLIVTLLLLLIDYLL
jgi:hypothetical protein